VRRIGKRTLLAISLGWLSVAVPGLASEPLRVAPGTLVRWPVYDADVCQVEDRRWAVLDETCYFPIDLLQPAGPLELVRWRASRREARLIDVAAYPYPVQSIMLPDDRMVHLSEADLQRVLAEQERLARLWQLESPRRFELPLRAPLEPLPRGGRFGSKRIINGEPRNPHSGTDYTAPAGAPVRSAGRGSVVLTDEHFFGGNSVFVDHGDGLISMYLHLSRIEVDVGQQIERGQVVGLVGATGRATGPHLHFGVRWHGARIDPNLLLGDPREIPELGP